MSNYLGNYLWPKYCCADEQASCPNSDELQLFTKKKKMSGASKNDFHLSESMESFFFQKKTLNFIYLLLLLLLFSF